MGKEVVYCAGCGDRIPASDFDRGVALTVQQRHLCKVCAITEIEEAPEGAAPDPTGTTRPLKVRTNRVPRGQEAWTRGLSNPIPDRRGAPARSDASSRDRSVPKIR